MLKESLAAFARGGGGGIDNFVGFLSDLPSGVSEQRKAEALAADMADQLRGKIAVNPLLNAKGQALDPAVLFTASRPGVTRVSVINFSGLHADESRQDFVNQLHMALFTFIRKYPSETPRLYALDEAQNFAPSQAMTASKASAMALAAQARKFGLGMIFATQAPKGIETKIVSNCTTHFYGRMSSPALIEATEEMMAARGKAAGDLGRLSAGIFYYSTEGMSAPVKIRAPLCLSNHPKIRPRRTTFSTSQNKPAQIRLTQQCRLPGTELFFRSGVANACLGQFQSVRFLGKQFGSGRSKRRRADTRQVTAVLHNRYHSDERPSFCLPARRAWTGGQMPSPMPAGGSPSS